MGNLLFKQTKNPFKREQVDPKLKEKNVCTIAIDKCKSTLEASIRKFRKNMLCLLKLKDKSTLLRECQSSCCTLPCPSQLRMYLILKMYQDNQVYICSSLVRVSSICDIMSFGNYGYQQLHDDFLHLKLNHINDFKLFRKYKNAFKCDDISDCCGFKRHYRDRNINDKEIYYQQITDNKTKANSITNNKQIIFQQLCDKIHSFFLHSIATIEVTINGTGKEQINIDKLSTNISNNSYHRNCCKYAGTKYDQKWFDEIDEVESDEIQVNYNKLYNSEWMGFFQWQTPHGFRGDEYRAINHIKPKYPNLKAEFLNNKYQSVSTDTWNQTLRKSKAFYDSFASCKIRCIENGSYDDKMTNITSSWKKGEEISLKEIVPLKFYTDFDRLQTELKKCFRSCSNKIGFIYELKMRLSSYYHWRSMLVVVLNKFGKSISNANKNEILYHGVNAKMILNLSKTFSFYGPLSTSTSYHVAKMFATQKGMVLQLTSQYPHLNVCKSFNVSSISDYPEEQEWLLSFMYLRVLKVKTREISKDINQLPLQSRFKEIFFVIHLFKQQIFSMSKHLEKILITFLEKHSIQDIVNIQDEPSKKQEIMFKILTEKFEEFRQEPNRHQILKLDQISDGLKKYFLDYDTVTQEWYVSIKKIIKIYPKIQQIHCMNEYKFKEQHIRDQLINHLEKQNNTLRSIKFLYYTNGNNLAAHSLNVKKQVFGVQNYNICLSMKNSVIKYQQNRMMIKKLVNIKIGQMNIDTM